MSDNAAVTRPTDPLYIIGTERSGSNLLRVILNAHTDIDVPHPPHILKYFHPLSRGYGDLSRTKNRRDLVQDILRLLRTHIYPWAFQVDAERVVNEANPHTLLGVFASIYDQHLAYTGKRRWGCKSTFMVHHVEEALARDEGARFIWLVRDPRDVAASSRRSVFSPYHPIFTAELWDAQQREAMAALERHPGAVYRVRYEDLITDLEPTLQALMTFLGEDLQPAMLAHEETAAAKKGANLSESWQNTGQKVKADNHGKYRSALSVPEIALVQQVAGETMTRLGYSLDDVAVRPDGPIARSVYGIQDVAWQLKTEARSVFKDANHWRRWRRAMLMRALGWRRGSA